MCQPAVDATDSLKMFVLYIRCIGTQCYYCSGIQPRGKEPLGRPRRRWVDNIRTDLGEVGWGDVDWIGLAQDRNRWRALVNSVLNLRVP
jgi:hypothetical protein